jgi:serine/threonine-protein kinase
MSPEQASGNLSAITPQTDVYCLGGILYEMLVDRPPFIGEDLTDTLVQIIEREPIPPTRLSPELPKEIEWICLRCLEKKPERRYPSAFALADDLDRFLRGEETETQPPTPWNRVRRWIRRTPALASHWIAIAIFFINSLLNYRIFRIVEADFFLKTSVLLVAWISVCYIFQRWLQKEERAGWARFGWACADITFFTAILLCANGVSSPLIIGYPLLIVVSGLWFRKGLVWFMTGLATASYVVLLLDSLLFRPELSVRFEHPVIFLVSLGILGFVVAYQVGRIHALEKYYHSRPLR